MSKNNRNFKLKVREKEQSQRQLKVSRAIFTSLMECFRNGGHLQIALDKCPLSVTKVNISPDLRVANCFFVPFNTELTAEQILDVLEESRFVIRNYVTRQVNLKYSPEIRFYYDTSFEKGEDIIALTRDAIKSHGN